MCVCVRERERERVAMQSLLQYRNYKALSITKDTLFFNTRYTILQIFCFHIYPMTS